MIKVNDVFRWSYVNPSSMDPYWCRARIIIVFQHSISGELLLEDIYWSPGSTRTTFKEEDIGTKIEVNYLGNLDDYTKISKHHMRCYNPKDILDITHPNSMGDLIYLKNGAQKDLQIMEKELQYQITKIEDDIRYKTSQMKDLKERLSTLSVDTYI
jgi:hypothetical protein